MPVFIRRSMREEVKMPLRRGAESRQTADERKESVATASPGTAETMPVSEDRFPCNSLKAIPVLR
jgi:hypothetical protein